ncbi:MAG: cytochrome c oxidase subunit I [Bradyrhizobium sp.]
MSEFVSEPGGELRDNELDQSELATVLLRLWRTPSGWLGALTSVDHKVIGKRYILTAFAFLILGGLLAVLMRLQLAGAERKLLSPDLYNQIFTMHGSTMMFLFAVPVMEAFAVYFVPLMVGTRNIAFPRLNAFSYWMFLFGGCFLWIAFFFNVGPDIGWFAYVPLSNLQYTPSKRADVWAQMITFTEVAALAVAVEIIVTVFKQRAVGMTLDRIPIFVWAMLVTSFLVLFAMPSIMVASTTLILDRLVNTHFYDTASGGNVLLWQHLFWFFGHPEVYIIFLPATGFVSEIVATFSRRTIVGYPIVVMSLVATGILAFGLWVHHMFATGLPRIGYSFYTAASMSVSIPTGLQIFCWIATLWEGRPRLQVPLLYVIGFIFTFVIGGLTGVIIAAVPLDLQLHDTYFIVAHFHYVLIGGAVFPLLGAITYWYPKATGRLMSEKLGKIAFWMIFLGFQLAFFPMHIAGINGMPRRVYTYPAGMGLELPNLLSSIGSMIVALAVLLFVMNLVWSLRSGRKAQPNPWGGASLEWSATCPPAKYNFEHIPVVDSRTPLWDAGETMSVVHGLRADDREVLLTTVMTAKPDLREPSAEPSAWPFIATVATTVMFICSIFSPWAVLFGAVPATIALIAWFWPKSPAPEREPVIS